MSNDEMVALLQRASGLESQLARIADAMEAANVQNAAWIACEQHWHEEAMRLTLEWRKEDQALAAAHQQEARSMKEREIETVRQFRQEDQLQRTQIALQAFREEFEPEKEG